MKILPIVTGATTDVLNRKALPVELPVSETTQSLLNDMVVAMRKAQGVGLAAPQVGVSLRLCVVEIDNVVTQYINPEITSRSQEKIFFEEGCLSLPGEFFPIERHEKITLKYYTEKGLPKRLRASGLLAIVLQHEIDHLDGVLICNRYRKQKSKHGKIYGRVIE